MFFGIFGKRKNEISLQQAYWDYRHRYDIEPSFRFNKQKMFLDSYDCEHVQYLDNFLLANQLANWLLFVVADEVNFIPRKWERNKTNPPPKPDKLSIAKTRRSAERLFLTFDKKPFLPKPSKKGKGNIKKERPHFKVVRKTKKSRQTIDFWLFQINYITFSFNGSLAVGLSSCQNSKYYFNLQILIVIQ